MNWLYQIEAWLNGLFSDPETLKVAFIFAVGAIGFGLFLALAFLINGFLNPVKNRVGTMTAKEEPDGRSEARLQLISRLGRYIGPKEEGKRGRIETKLQHAGYRRPNALGIFLATKVAAMVVFPLLALAVLMLAGMNLDNALVYGLFGIAVGYIVPDALLARKVRRRQERLRKGLPDALDLMVVCTEAGLGLNGAIQRVGEELDVPHPELSEELHLVIMQTRAGIDNQTALKDLQVRTGLDDIGAFVTTLLQAMRFGTSIADSLRIFAEEMRDKRLQRAQEQAAKLSVKMMLPIAFCMLPAFLLVAIGPALIGLSKAFTTMGLGQ